jgi:hypothetical protein
MTTNPPCAGRTDFYRVLNNDGWHCFASDGELDVFITNVTAVSPGNNKGHVMTTGGDWSPWRGPGEGIYYFNFPVTVLKIEIRGR